MYAGRPLLALLLRQESPPVVTRSAANPMNPLRLLTSVDPTWLKARMWV